MCVAVFARGDTAAYSSASALQTKHREASGASDRRVAAAQLRDGDLVFRAGRDLVSHLVLRQGEGSRYSRYSRYSHVGVLVWRDAAPYVVHAVPEDAAGPGGVRLERLERFVARDVAERVSFARPRELAVVSSAAAARRSQLRTYALAQLGKPFDDAFVYSDDAQLYCTELALKALASARIDVRDVPRVHLPLHEESIPLPDDLSRWHGLAAIADAVAPERADDAVAPERADDAVAPERADDAVEPAQP